MPSSNFEFLRRIIPELAELGGFAEQYIYADPSSCAVKLRSFLEKFVDIVYQISGTVRVPESNLHELLTNDKFLDAIPRSIIPSLHTLRIRGNKAAHGENISSEEAASLVKIAFDISQWIAISFFGLSESDIPVFNQSVRVDIKNTWSVERQKVLKELIEKENQVEKLVFELSLERQKNENLRITGSDLANLFSKGQATADELKFSEAATRKYLIDQALISAGWDVGKNGKNTSEVTQEEKVDGQPTKSGIGYIDYVLWDSMSNKPLAIIEAKKTSVDANEGKKQASLYADSLQKKYNHRPVIYYTNGYDVYLWNDRANEPPRQIWGFYSKDSLEYLLFKSANKVSLNSINANDKIINRLYQYEALKRVTEKFENKRRKALIVLATGTGKTRVAVAICDALSRAGWTKRILFLCDRRELRKQAKNVFQEYLGGEPWVYVNQATYRDRQKRIYLATYPAISQVYQSFDVGFFDLIIADESHRSIYNSYSDIFQYFDCLQIGLTATPRNIISHNTFSMFDCKPNDPTAYYDYEDAIKDNPPYLTPFEVFNVTTKFQRDGIKYAELTDEQKQQLEEQYSNAESFDFEKNDVDRIIFNKDTSRSIIRNLMDNGIRDASGMQIGKTIIFARNHFHAVQLQEAFDELYPQYGGKFCQIIDTYDPRSEQLIDDFKGLGTNPELTIAISVDMLDTGIDVPEILNLVFAKPIKSYVKFWQMIGRGTRLCQNLLGGGKDKAIFRIFDHWGNFEWFDLYYKNAQPDVGKSLYQRIFEERILLAENALQKFDQTAFDMAIELITRDLNSVDSCNSITVREHRREIKTLLSDNNLKNFSPEVKQLLQTTIAPLMHEVYIRGQYDAYNFDLLITRAQSGLLKKTSIEDYKGELINKINALEKNLNQVKEKSNILSHVLSENYWASVTVLELERVRKELRSIMQFHQNIGPVTIPHKIVDIAENEEDFISERYKIKNKQVDMVAYRVRVESVLKSLVDNNVTLNKIRSGEPINNKDLDILISMILTQHPDIDLSILNEFFPETSGHLDLAIRNIIGLNPEFINERLSKFVFAHPELNSTQIKFISMIKNHISKYGSLKFEKLYEAPFTTIHTQSIYGVFPDTDQANEIINIVREINQPYKADIK